MSDPIFLSLDQVLYIQKAEAFLTHSPGHPPSFSGCEQADGGWQRPGGFGFRLSEQGSHKGRLDPVFQETRPVKRALKIPPPETILAGYSWLEPEDISARLVYAQGSRGNVL